MELGNTEGKEVKNEENSSPVFSICTFFGTSVLALDVVAGAVDILKNDSSRCNPFFLRSLDNEGLVICVVEVVNSPSSVNFPT